MHGTNRLIALFIILFSFLLSLAMPGSMLLGDDSDNQDKNELGIFFSHVWEEEKTIWGTPFRKKTWKSPATYLFAGAIAGSFALDDGFSRDLRQNTSFSDFNKITNSAAVDWIQVAYPLATLAVGKMADNAAFSEYGWELSEGALNAFIVSKALKFAAGRNRPHTGDIYGFREGGNSFPSGHSIIFWTLAETTVQHFKGKKWVPWIAYPLAGLVSFSRITSGNHFTSDVVTGSIIGFSIGHWTTK